VDRSGRKILPNVTRVFHSGQNLFVYLEVYDPGVSGDDMQGNTRTASVAASLTLFRGAEKVMQTPHVRVTQFDRRRHIVMAVRLKTRFGDLKPGQYTCQVSVIDELSRKFSFPRTLLVVMAAGETAVDKGQP